jgi:membrane protein implicated in regulation of membrane protease activity
MIGSPRMLVAFTLAAALVVGAIVGLATGFWWALALALAAHFGATAFVMVFIAGRMNQQDKPDPLTETRIEETRPPLSAR